MHAARRITRRRGIIWKDSTSARGMVHHRRFLVLALVERYSSLAIGVFVGMVIYQFSLNSIMGVEPLVDIVHHGS